MSDDTQKSVNRRKRFLIGQLGSFGDCLYATTIARQIKNDYPDCHLTWAIGSIYRSILNGNPYIDEIWEFPLSTRNDLLNRWQQFENEAIQRKRRGDFDEIFLTQVFPNNLKNFDGTLRSSIFRAYRKPITVPVTPVLRLSPTEIGNVRTFAESHRLQEKKYVILFESSPKSGQSFVTSDFALEVAKKLVEKVPDLCVIISSNDPLDSNDERIIDGSVLSFRENAELTKYCTFLIGCSSGISWISTSDWAKPLPKVQLLKRETCMYASFVHDHKHHKISSESIIEMTECPPDKLTACVTTILTDGFKAAKQKYHEQIRINFRNYAGIIYTELLKKGKYPDAISSVSCTARRWLSDVLIK